MDITLENVNQKEKKSVNRKGRSEREYLYFHHPNLTIPDGLTRCRIECAFSSLLHSLTSDFTW